jgi:hypothetical protein
LYPPPFPLPLPLPAVGDGEEKFSTTFFLAVGEDKEKEDFDFRFGLTYSSSNPDKMVENAANSFAELSNIVVVISSNSFEKELLSVCLKVRSKRRVVKSNSFVYSFVL